jgi:hypothetical protein
MLRCGSEAMGHPGPDNPLLAPKWSTLLLIGAQTALFMHRVNVGSGNEKN